MFLPKIAQKGKSCSRLLEPQKGAPNRKTNGKHFNVNTKTLLESPYRLVYNN